MKQRMSVAEMKMLKLTNRVTRENKIKFEYVRSSIGVVFKIDKNTRE